MHGIALRKHLVVLAVTISLSGVASAWGATVTFTPVGSSIVGPGTPVVYEVTVSVSTIAQFDTADVIIGSDDAIDIAFTYSTAWTSAFANVSAPFFDTGMYAQDAFVGGNNPTPVGTSLLLGTITVTTTGLPLGVYAVRVDNAIDGVSTLGLGGQPDPLSGVGVFEIRGCSVDADCNDGVACTTESCDLATGQCVNAADHAVCDDGLFCTGFEVCDRNVGCVTPGNPCPNPGDCNEIVGNCGCQPPVVTAIGPRYMEITPIPGLTPIALHVTSVDPDVSCIAPYVQADGTLDVAIASAASSDWGTLSVRDANLVSSKTYSVQADCDPANPGTVMSAPAPVTLWQWGDTNNDGSITILDITRGIDGFRSVFHLPAVLCLADADCAAVGPNFKCDTAAGLCAQLRLENVDHLGPSGCGPETVISILDIVWIVDSFRAVPHNCLGTCLP